MKQPATSPRIYQMPHGGEVIITPRVKTKRTNFSIIRGSESTWFSVSLAAGKLLEDTIAEVATVKTAKHRDAHRRN